MVYKKQSLSEGVSLSARRYGMCRLFLKSMLEEEKSK